MAALLHENKHTGGHDDDDLAPSAAAEQMEHSADIVDAILDNDDLDGNGYLDFQEYVRTVTSKS